MWAFLSLGLRLACAVYSPGCHTNESRALYKISPLAERTVTTADRTAASRLWVASRVRNLPSIVTVPAWWSQRRWTVSGLIRASKQPVRLLDPRGRLGEGDKSLRPEAETGESEATHRKAIAWDIVPFGIGLKGWLAWLRDRRCQTPLGIAGRRRTGSQHDDKAYREAGRHE